MKKKTKEFHPVKVKSEKHLRELMGLPEDWETWNRQDKAIWAEIMHEEIMNHD